MTTDNVTQDFVFTECSILSPGTAFIGCQQHVSARMRVDKILEL